MTIIRKIKEFLRERENQRLQRDRDFWSEKILTEFPEYFSYGTTAQDGPFYPICFGFECGTGWLPLVYDFCEECRTNGLEIRFTQIKEKYGSLRLYHNVVNEEEMTEEESERLWRLSIDLEDKYEDISLRTCEVCGKPGTSEGDGWVSTLCKKHREQRYDVY